MVPDIGDLKDIPVIEILVKTGDRVTRDTPLLVLESDKATLEVPSPEDGTVSEIKVAVGARVSVGSWLLTLDGVSGNKQESPPNHAEPYPVLDIEVPAGAVAPSPTANDDQRIDSRETTLSKTHHPAASSTSSRTSHGSPSIRRMAREVGIDLSVVAGTGRRGRIVREDLYEHIKNALVTPARPADSDSVGGIKLAAWPKIDFSRFGTIERAPLSKIRRLAGASLMRNAVVIPHVTNFEDADITELEEFRKSLNAVGATSHTKVTILPFLIKSVAATLSRYERFNSSLDGDEIVMKRYFHVGFATDTPNGLMVPVIRDVNSKSITQIASETANFASQARAGTLKPGDMQGGCFTVSSLGGVGGTGFTPIINAPEVAILGVSRAQMRPIWNGNEFCPRLMLPLMLSWDHRVVDGIAAAQFLVYLSGLLADVRKLLL
jgi:pyruvate dehydrogenase E2 component (dihydrolipoamide acetyltransferase)